MQIGEIDRARIGTFPTPLQELDRLAERLGGPRLFVKRDDLTGLGLGGNKLRKLEYAMAEATALGATTIITIGGPQSNHVRLTTAAANRLGMKTILILRGEEPPRPSGNLLVDRILGAAEIHFIGGDGFPSKSEADRNADAVAEKIAERLRAGGEIPYVIPNGCKAIHGALGYAGCVLESVTQLHALGTAPTAIVCAVGTSSTQTGLILGAHLYTQGAAHVHGISVVATEAEDLERRIAGQLDEACRNLELDLVPHDAVRVHGGYVGEGYGLPTDAMHDAVLLTARTEGIVLDPVYTGKAMSGLIDLVRSGTFTSDDVVVFLHTGGVPGLFADEKVDAFVSVLD
jgi:D-cysteine desulfhydrase family pyridoxal phosphate-dependent enzyme